MTQAIGMVSAPSRWNAGIILLALGMAAVSTGCNEKKAVDSYPEEYSGIGVEMEMRQGYPVVLRAFEGGPASKAGLRNGDIITEIDGESTRDDSLGDVVMNIRGLTGTQVLLTVTGPGRPKRMVMPVTRGQLGAVTNGGKSAKKYEAQKPQQQVNN